MTFEKTREQIKAIEDARKWWKTPEQVFRLMGYAGTGKTSIAKEIAANIDGLVLFAAFTGKAVSVLNSKGCPATTLHSLLYKVIGEVRDPITGYIRPVFELNEESPLLGADLLIIDEASMVNEEMATQILERIDKVIVIGDPAQLPPVRGEGYLMNGHVHALLTEVKRHGSETLKIATNLRNGGIFEYSEGIRWTDALDFDQVIVGLNATRWRANVSMRFAKGLKSGEPVKGDKLICVRNNYDLGVMNGEPFVVVGTNMHDEEISIEAPDGTVITVPFWARGLTEDGDKELNKMSNAIVRNAVWFNFGWAITCHKSQGSEWSSILVIDEPYFMRKSLQPAWRYTAATRAKEKLTVIKSAPWR